MGRFLVALLLIAVTSPLRAQQHEHRLPAPLIEMAAKEVKLPLTFVQGRPVVLAKIDGQGPYRFYFDTGASGPVMNVKVADELKLKRFHDMEVRVKSGGDAPGQKPIAAKLVVIKDLELGQAKLMDVPIAAFDRAGLGGDDAPVGVLSPNLFPEYLVTIDYPQKELRLTPGALPAADGKTIFDYLKSKSIPALVVNLAGQEIETHLDSGAAGGMSLPRALAERLPLAGPLVDTKRKARSVTGEFPVFEGKLQGRLTVGQFTFENPALEFTDVVRTGNLGAKILGDFVVTLDVKNRRFRLERPTTR